MDQIPIADEEEKEEAYLKLREGLDARALLDTTNSKSKKGRYFGRESNTFLIRQCLLLEYSRTETVVLLRALGRELDYTYVSREWRILKLALGEHVEVAKRLRRLPSLKGRRQVKDEREYARETLRQAGFLYSDIVITDKSVISAKEGKRVDEITARKLMAEFAKNV